MGVLIVLLTAKKRTVLLAEHSQEFLKPSKELPDKGHSELAPWTKEAEELDAALRGEKSKQTIEEIQPETTEKFSIPPPPGNFKLRRMVESPENPKIPEQPKPESHTSSEDKLAKMIENELIGNIDLKLKLKEGKTVTVLNREWEIEKAEVTIKKNKEKARKKKEKVEASDEEIEKADEEAEKLEFGITS